MRERIACTSHTAVAVCNASVSHMDKIDTHSQIICTFDYGVT